jgi:metal-sulfur cluster biosynthetic enzyme
LRTGYDPEIPVHIVDLGLVYSAEVTPLEEGKRDIEVRMSMTAPGCGMGNVLKADVNIVFDPAWNPGRMSEAARLQLGIELDFGMPEPREAVSYVSPDNLHKITRVRARGLPWTSKVPRRHQRY